MSLRFNSRFFLLVGDEDALPLGRLSSPWWIPLDSRFRATFPVLCANRNTCSHYISIVCRFRIKPEIKGLHSSVLLSIFQLSKFFPSEKRRRAAQKENHRKKVLKDGGKNFSQHAEGGWKTAVHGCSHWVGNRSWWRIKGSDN